MKLLGSTENKTAKNKNGEIIPNFELTEVVLVFHNIVNNDYKIQDSRVLYTFVPSKLFGSLLKISPKNHVFLKTFHSEFQPIEVSFINKNSQPLEIVDKIDLTLVI